MTGRKDKPQSTASYFLCRMLLVITGIVVSAELAVLLIIRLFQPPTPYEFIINPAILIIFIVPMFLYFIYRPLNGEVNKRLKTERILQHRQEDLEQLVRERTDGLVKKQAALVKEINERKKVEAELKEKNEFLKIVIDSIDNPFYVIDVETYRIKLANRAAHEGKMPPGLTCYQLTHKRTEPCGGDDHPCSIAKVLETKRPAVTEHTHFDKQGRARRMEVHTHPIVDHAGKVKSVLEFAIDISDRKV